MRVLRGGSWDDAPRSLRFALRNWLSVGNRGGNLAFSSGWWPRWGGSPGGRMDSRLKTSGMTGGGCRE